MATHSSILAWKIPWIEEPGGLQSMGSQRVAQDWATEHTYHVPMEVACCCCCATSVVSDSVRPQRWQPTRLRRPRHSPGKNTGVGCHFLFQCMKVKSESEVTQSCPTLSDPMDCSLPGSSVHGIFQAEVRKWSAIAIGAHNQISRENCVLLFFVFFFFFNDIFLVFRRNIWAIFLQ